VLQRFATGAPVRFEPADGDVRLEGAVIEFGENGKATAIEAFRLSE
jgi:calcineurin-like phosphoesterase